MSLYKVPLARQCSELKGWLNGARRPGEGRDPVTLAFDLRFGRGSKSLGPGLRRDDGSGGIGVFFKFRLLPRRRKETLLHPIKPDQNDIIGPNRNVPTEYAIRANLDLGVCLRHIA